MRVACYANEGLHHYALSTFARLSAVRETPACQQASVRRVSGAEDSCASASWLSWFEAEGEAVKASSMRSLTGDLHRYRMTNGACVARIKAVVAESVAILKNSRRSGTILYV